MRLFHVSEQSGIKLFIPRPLPQKYDKIKGNVVFAVTDEMLHSYLLPRDCPRVTYYAKPDSEINDINKYIGNTYKKYIINIETGWMKILEKTILYLYEFHPDNFDLLDEGAGYYISYHPVTPLSVTIVNDPISEINKRNAELRISVDLKIMAELIKNSTLQFSIIRLRNAKS